MNENNSERLPDRSSNPYGMASSLNYREVTQQEQERNEDGKPCVPSETIILFEITFRQTSLSINESFCKDQKTLMLSEDHDKTRK